MRVLLVEDDRELREGLAENLRLNGVSVTEADSGVSFRNAMRSGTIDVAIIDVNLPDVSGFELARELARDERPPGIIMLTARTGHRDRRQGYSEGADLYMTKPVDGEELLLAVRNLARRVRRSQGIAGSDEPDQPGWKLDVARRMLISPDNAVILLSGREVMLLEQFVEAKGAPLSRSSISETMGYGSPGPTNRGLDAAIHRLREKAAERNAELPLLVIHSIGIRFAAPLRLA